MSKSGSTRSAETQPAAVVAQQLHLDEKRPQLNTDLHLRIVQEGTARPSTYESAMAALKKLRARRNQLQPPAG